MMEKKSKTRREMTAEKAADRACTQQPTSGQKQWQRDEARGKKKSVFGNKLASKEAALATWWGRQLGSRIKRGGVAPRGRQQVQKLVRKMRQ